jgi:hypothetical protein
VPFGVVLLLINVGLIVHAAKTGRFWPWGYINPQQRIDVAG